MYLYNIQRTIYNEYSKKKSERKHCCYFRDLEWKGWNYVGHHQASKCRWVSMKGESSPAAVRLYFWPKEETSSLPTYKKQGRSVEETTLRSSAPSYQHPHLTSPHIFYISTSTYIASSRRRRLCVPVLQVPLFWSSIEPGSLNQLSTCTDRGKTRDSFIPQLRLYLMWRKYKIQRNTSVYANKEYILCEVIRIYFISIKNNHSQQSIDIKYL